MSEIGVGLIFFGMFLSIAIGYAGWCIGTAIMNAAKTLAKHK